MSANTNHSLTLDLIKKGLKPVTFKLMRSQNKLPPAEEDHLVQSKAPEQLLSRPFGEILHTTKKEHSGTICFQTRRALFKGRDGFKVSNLPTDDISGTQKLCTVQHLIAF